MKNTYRINPKTTWAPPEHAQEYLDPHEQDEILSAIHAGAEKKPAKKEAATAVAHCDCRDVRNLGSMSPVEMVGDGLCALCGNYVMYKPLKVGTK